MGAKQRFKQNPGNSAIAYYRYSSAGQRDLSIDEQRAAAVNFAKERKLNIIKEYSDHAITGTTDERPNFQLMLDEVNDIKPAYLILWKSDRFSRNRIDAVLSKAVLRAAGVKVLYMTGGIPDEDDAARNILEAISEAMDENYIIKLREDVVRGMRFNAENALFNGRKILGYKGEKSKPYEIDETTAPIVRKIFTDFTEGVPLKKICDNLNNSGIRTLNNKEFTINSLRYVLKNRDYIGEYHWGDITVPGGIPPLISDEMFAAAQAKFEEKSRKRHQGFGAPREDTTVDFWLTGHIECGKCHAPMHGVSGTSRHGYKCYYYYCLGHRKKKCDLANKKKGEIEDIVLYLLNELLYDTTIIFMVSEACYRQYTLEHENMDGTIASLEDAIKKVNKKIENLADVIEDTPKASPRLLERLDKHEKEEAALKEALQSAKRKKDMQLKPEHILKFFRTMAGNLDDVEQRTKLLDLLVDKVYVYDDEIVVTFYFSKDKRRLNIKETKELIENRKMLMEPDGPVYDEEKFKEWCKQDFTDDDQLMDFF